MVNMPTTFNVSLLPQLDALYRVFEHVFDRNKALFPAYLVLDEIQKKAYPKDGTPHWKLSRLLSTFVDSFRPTANMCSIAGRHKLLPIVNYPSILGNSWKLDCTTGKFILKGLLPYRNELLEPQLYLLKYVLAQPYSKDFVCSMLNITLKQKQRCQILEDSLVDLMLVAMQNSEGIENFSETKLAECLFFWQHLSSQTIYFVLFHHASLPHMLIELHTKLKANPIRSGREQLMWMLLQFLSGVMLKGPIEDFLPVLKVYDLLYPEKDALPLPSMNRSTSVHYLAAAANWMIFMRKAESDQLKISRSVPNALKQNVEFLRNTATSATTASLPCDFTLAATLNFCTANPEHFTRITNMIIENITQPSASAAYPVAVAVLDTLTAQTKMSLNHNIANQILIHAQNKSSNALSPGLIETYARLLVYPEIETLGIKALMTQLLNTAWRSHAWNVLHILFEMFSYRLHHIPSHYRVQLLGHLHSLCNQPQTNMNQLQLCMEATALKLILGLSSGEILAIPQFTRYQNEPKSLISVESEELNKVLILTLARAIHVTGSETLSADWCKELLSNIAQNTPITWSSGILQCFPPVIREFYGKSSHSSQDHKPQLKRQVDDEYRKWISMTNENEIVTYFTQPSTPPLFICLVWRMLVENDRFNPVAYKVLEKIGCRGLSAHLRYFADYLVFEIAKLVGSQHVNKFIDATNDLCWRHNLVTLDRLLWCLILRTFEDNEAQVCLYTIQRLLLKPNDFKRRVDEFVEEFSPEYWKQTDWHEKQFEFVKKHPEKLYYDGIHDPNAKHCSVQFSNICLRFLPILDLIVHRYLEQPMSGSVSVDAILDQLGSLYKFHEHPINYLYNTLHYYEHKLKQKPQLKKKLVAAVVGAFKDVRPRNWALSDSFISYMSSTKEPEWLPDLDYFVRLVGRLVDTLAGRSVFSFQDWRFNEFTSVGSHALHVTCVELMALPRTPTVVAHNLLDVVFIGHKAIARSNVLEWLNAIGLILTALPDTYWLVLNERLLQALNSTFLTTNPTPSDLFRQLDFAGLHHSVSEPQLAYLIALAHSVYHHASVGQISSLPQFLSDKVKPIIRNEAQFLFVCHIVAPFLQRFSIERTRIVMEVTKELYEMLAIVDQNSEQLLHMDSICDLLYHIKYMFTGDSVKQDVERCIRSLRQPLQLRLRFITHLAFQAGNTHPPPPPPTFAQQINPVSCTVTLTATNTTTSTTFLSSSNSMST